VAGHPKNDKNRANPNQHHFMQATSSTSNIKDGMQLQLAANVDKGFKPIVLPQRLPPALILNPNVSNMMSPTNSDSNTQLDKEISVASMLKVEMNVEDQDKVETEIPR
jgi:hypothetical protein